MNLPIKEYSFTLFIQLEENTHRSHELNEHQEFLRDVEKHSLRIKPQVDLNILAKCPKCKSIYIEDFQCQSCFFKLDYDLLGEPLGERSFYTLRENYWSSLSPLERENIKFFKDEALQKSYLNKVKFRYNDLLDFFYSKDSIRHESRAVFLHELRDIVIELMESGVSEGDIWKPLNEKDSDFNLFNQTLFDRIKEVIEQQNKLKKQGRRQSLLSYKFAGNISLSSILVGTMFLVLFISLSLAYFSYQKAII